MATGWITQTHGLQPLDMRGCKRRLIVFLLREIDECYSFYEYMKMFEATGAKITKDD
jgi:hypothetical protein